MKFRSVLWGILAISPAVAFAAATDFTRSLSMGMRGEDVRALQVVLNKDPETRIAVSGAGSPGDETDYFGPATKRALIKFQEKYRVEVLAPAGLAAGTGFFGEKTRAKASALLAKDAATTLAPSLQKDPTATLPKDETPVAKGDVFVMFPSQYSGKPGTVITISGMGFTDIDNTIYFGPDNTVVQAFSRNGQSITFKVPSLPKGNYPLWVKNARGESNKDAFFVVTDGVTPEPVIESISPTQGARGSTVILAGSGFVAYENTVRTGTNIIEHVGSPDGRSLSVTIPLDTLSATTTSSAAKTTSIPTWVYVVNENGVSNGKSFTLGL